MAGFEIPWLCALGMLSVLSVLSVSSTALAQQPLTEFLAAADERALDVREAEAALSQAESQVAEARARLLPAIVGQLFYQRNEPAVVVSVPTGMLDAAGMPITREAAITPADQYGANATATVPLIDLSAWAGLFQAGARADAASAIAELTHQNVDVAVVQLWHLLVAQRALVEAAERNVETTSQAREAVAAQVEVGVAGQLELARADAELSRARQSLSEAQLAATLTAKNLENLTGLRPSADEVALTETVGEDEAALKSFTSGTKSLPAVRAAQHQVDAADHAHDAAWLALLPTINANGAARWTNAAGFGQRDSYYVGLAAVWQLDFARPARVGTADASLEGARIRAERAQQQAETAIFDAWNRVRASRVSAEAAMSAREASRRAAADARARYESGAATQLDSIQAQRDLFQSEVAVIQAIANLDVARATLRIRSGQPLR